MSDIGKDFIEEFWKWFDEHHRKRYRNEGRIGLYPVRKFHEKNMRFKDPVWSWIAMFVKESYDKKGDAHKN